MGKSQIKSQVQITNHLQKLFKSTPQIKNQITNNQIKSKSFLVKIKSNHKISNQIQIKSHVFQIKSLFFKSTHYVWFNHDLNQIMIWICPSLLASGYVIDFGV